MTTTPGQPVSVTLAAINPPFDADHGVLFGLQSKSGVDDPVPATASTTFHTEIHVRTSRDGVEFAGDHVHGATASSTCRGDCPIRPSRS